MHALNAEYIKRHIRTVPDWPVPGVQVIEGAAIVDLPELGGSRKLKDAGLALFTLVDYDGH